MWLIAKIMLATKCIYVRLAICDFVEGQHVQIMKPIFKIMQLKFSSRIQFTLMNVDYFQATVFNLEQVVMYFFVGAIQNRCTVLNDRS